MYPKKSQSIIDYAIALIAVAALAVGIVRIWIWFNANYAKREVSYQASRIVAAGVAKGHSTPITGYKTPVDIGATESCPDCTYSPMELTEDWVFKGIVKRSITGKPIDTTSGSANQAFCNASCASKCAGDAACLGGANLFCSCYQTCSSQCYCKENIKSTLDIYATQVVSLCGPDKDCDACKHSDCDTSAGCGQACSLRKNAQSMRDTAKKCDDPWEICWWGTWGKTSGELKEAANQLDNSAKELEDSAKRIAKNSLDLEECCNKTSSAVQATCIDQVKIETQCASQCVQEKQKYNVDYQTCYNSCITLETTTSCKDRTEALVSTLTSQKTEIETGKANLKDAGTALNGAISSCATSFPSDASKYAACCKKIKCAQEGDTWVCKDYGTQGWNNDCSTLSANMKDESNTLEAKLKKITEAISDLPGCCNLATATQQNTCIESKIQ